MQGGYLIKELLSVNISSIVVRVEERVGDGVEAIGWEMA